MDQQDLLTKPTEVAVSEVIDKVSRLAPKPALWFGLSGHNRGESDSHSLAFLLTDRDDVSSAIGERNADFVLDISSLDKADYLAKFGEFLHELMTNGMSGENFLWALTQVVLPVGLTKNETEKRLSEVFSKLGSPDQIQWEWSRNTNCTKTFGRYMDLLASPKAQLAGENPHTVLKEQIGIREYGCCTIGTFKNAKVYFVDSLKGLRQLEADLKRTDLVKSERRDMEQWFDYPEPRGKTIRLNNFDSVVVLHYGERIYRGEGENAVLSIVTHEALHVLFSLCKHISYNPLNEQEPAAYAMEHIVMQALNYYRPRMELVKDE